MCNERWSIRPEGSNWGDFGADDQIGRLNLVTPAVRRAAAAEVREGLAFCLSLPLDCPRHVMLHPRRVPPEISYFQRGDDATMNYPMARVFADQTDVVCDDKALLSLQFSTQWDSLCHIGSLFDPQGDGREQATYYNGYRAGSDVRGPVDYLDDQRDLDDAYGARALGIVEHPRALEGPYGAMALGVETLAKTGMQTRGVMIDLHAHVGLEPVAVGYDALMRILEADQVEVAAGDVLCFRTGFDRALLARYNDPDAPFDAHRCSGLDGTDPALLKWITDSGAVALVSDNEAVERIPDPTSIHGRGTRFPIHHLCLFKLGMPLGEMFLLSDLADWLRANGRSRFLFTAPPLRLPGAVGSPVTGVGTV